MGYTARIVRYQQIEAHYRLAQDIEKLRPVFAELAKAWGNLVADLIEQPRH